MKNDWSIFDAVLPKYLVNCRRRFTERNVVELTGTSPKWWDTRCSKLRFDPARLGFETVV
jgi:hypothetical protein